MLPLSFPALRKCSGLSANEANFQYRDKILDLVMRLLSPPMASCLWELCKEATVFLHFQFSSLFIPKSPAALGGTEASEVPSCLKTFSHQQHFHPPVLSTRHFSPELLSFSGEVQPFCQNYTELAFNLSFRSPGINHQAEFPSKSHSGSSPSQHRGRTEPGWGMKGF